MKSMKSMKTVEDLKIRQLESELEKAHDNTRSLARGASLAVAILCLMGLFQLVRVSNCEEQMKQLKLKSK